MHSEPRDQVTQHLAKLREGDASAAEALLPDVYDELRALAERAFRSQGGGHTLQPTVLVHDAYMRLVRSSNNEFEDRRHFFRVAAKAMRRLLIDYARARSAEKRGGGRERVLLEEVEDLDGRDEGVDLVELNEALSDLGALEPRLAQVVELRFLAGLTLEEVAEALGVTSRTVSLDWRMARSWLRGRLGGEEVDASND